MSWPTSVPAATPRVTELAEVSRIAATQIESLTEKYSVSVPCGSASVNWSTAATATAIASAAQSSEKFQLKAWGMRQPRIAAPPSITSRMKSRAERRIPLAALNSAPRVGAPVLGAPVLRVPAGGHPVGGAPVLRLPGHQPGGGAGPRRRRRPAGDLGGPLRPRRACPGTGLPACIRGSGAPRSAERVELALDQVGRAVGVEIRRDVRRAAARVQRACAGRARE